MQYILYLFILLSVLMLMNIDLNLYKIQCLLFYGVIFNFEYEFSISHIYLFIVE